MYNNIRYLDDQQTQKCVIPCTPLAVVKILEHVGVYNSVLPYGDVIGMMMILLCYIICYRHDTI